MLKGSISITLASLANSCTAIFLLCFLYLSSVGNVEALSKKWHVYQSDHFTMYSDLSEKRTKQRLKRFESYRQALGLFLEFDATSSEANHDILVFKNSNDYHAIAPKSSAGVYLRNRPTPTMLMVGRHFDKEFSEAILYHEYIHHLMLTNNKRFYPHWYREGVAELLAYTQIKGRSVSLGLSSAILMYSLRQPRQLSVRDLIEPDYSLKSRSNPYWGKFYARAWLLAHYIQFGSFADMPDRSKSLATYLKMYQSGQNTVADFEKAFQVSIKDLDKELDRYLALSSLPGITFQVEKYDGLLTKRKMTPSESSFLYADVAYYLGKEKSALLHYSRASELSPQDELKKDLHTAIALNHKKHLNREASDVIKRIEQKGYANLDVFSQAGLLHYYLDVLTDDGKKESDFDMELAAKIEFLSKQSIKQHPDDPAAYYWLDRMYKALDNSKSGFENRKAWFIVEPAHIYNRLSLAYDYADMGNYQMALEHLNYALAWLHGDDEIAEARELEKKIKEAMHSSQQAS